MEKVTGDDDVKHFRPPLGYTPFMSPQKSESGTGYLWPIDKQSRSSPSQQPAKQGLITAFCDGGARGNPGPAGFGVYIQDERGEKLAELSEYLGIRTNNFAEYSGLLAALEFALRYDHPRLRVVSDSELMVKQIKGEYKVKSPDLRPLYEEAKRRIAGLDFFQIQHVLRNKNKDADRLANEAMDKGMRKTGVAQD